MKTRESAGWAAILALLSVTAQGSGINGIHGGMPNRISMNVTVPKQTQGATFGEKVSGGLQAAGSAVAQGASFALVVECGPVACTVAFPGGDGNRADLQRRRVEVLKSNKIGDADANRARTVGQEAPLPGGAPTGAGIVSAAVSSVGTLAGSGGGAASASYARSAHGDIRQPVVLGSTRRAEDSIDVLDPLADGDYLLTVVVEKATSGLKDTLKTNVRTRAPQRIEIVLGFNVEAGVLKTRHDMAMTAIRNMK